MKKRISVVVAAVAVTGAVLAGVVPALGQVQEQELVTESVVACPYHDQADMTGEGMEEWMGSRDHDAWMDSAEHARMHDAAGDTRHMTTGRGMMNPANMMGAGTATGNMMTGRFDR